MSDKETIYRQDAIDVLHVCLPGIPLKRLNEILSAVPSAQSDNDKQELIRAITAGIVATNTKDVYSCGMRNGMRWCKGLLEEDDPKFEDASLYANPEQRHGRIFQGIDVEYPSISTYPECEGKPYFSIKYTEDGQDFIGYGTYKPEVLSEYLIEYFMPSAEPEHTMEEFMYGQELGDPEDGSL